MTAPQNPPKRSLSGIKPTGLPHLGNYLGMIRPAIALQDAYEAFYFVADYHSMTTVTDPTFRRHSTHMITAQFLAFGLDPARAAFFRQSDVPQVCELTWMLSSVIHMGFLQRAHSYKAAIDRDEETVINHAIFSYPVLMAADILIYDSDVVPVGADQIQHMEMTRDMAQRFNQTYGGEFLKLPEAIVQKSVATVPGVDGRKMSKSYGNIIEPLLPPKKLRKQIMTIVTDSLGLDDPKDPETCNIFTLYKLFASQDEIAQMAEDYRRGGYGYGHAKQALFEKMDATFAPYRERYNELMTDPDTLEDVLRAGAQRVMPTVEEVMHRVREAAGLGRG